MILSVICIAPVTASADTAITLGKTYSGSNDDDYYEYYTFTMTSNANVYVQFKTNNNQEFKLSGSYYDGSFGWESPPKRLSIISEREKTTLLLHTARAIIRLKFTRRLPIRLSSLKSQENSRLPTARLFRLHIPVLTSTRTLIYPSRQAMTRSQPRRFLLITVPKPATSRFIRIKSARRLLRSKWQAAIRLSIPCI